MQWGFINTTSVNLDDPKELRLFQILCNYKICNILKLFINEKKIIESDARVEPEAINIVASWYWNQEELKKKGKEERQEERQRRKD